MQTGLMNTTMFRDVETRKPWEYTKERDTSFTRSMALRLSSTMFLCNYTQQHFIHVVVKSYSSLSPPPLNFGIS